MVIYTLMARSRPNFSPKLELIHKATFHHAPHTEGVTLAQLVKASVGEAGVQRFEPHLGHNLFSCFVFLLKSRHFGLPLAQTVRPNWQSLLAGGFAPHTHEHTHTNTHITLRMALLIRQLFCGFFKRNSCHILNKLKPIHSLAIHSLVKTRVWM